MTHPIESSRWSGLPAPGDLLAEGRKAPLEVPVTTAAATRQMLETLLSGVQIPGGTIEAALSTASGLIEGLSEFITQSNRLIAVEKPAEMIEIARQLHQEIWAMLKLRDASYSVQQVAEIVASRRSPDGRWPPLPRFPRLKDYMSPLESRLEALGLQKDLDDARFATFLVHMDDFYDDASLHLARLYFLAARDRTEAEGLAPDFLRRLHVELVRGSFDDHLSALEPKKKEPGTEAGLAYLLPELIEALRRRG